MAYKINLHHIIDTIADKTPYQTAEIRKIVAIILDTFKTYLKDKDSIELRGLGTFYVKEHKAKRIALKTKIIDSKNHFVILFKESLELSKKVNYQEEEKNESQRI